MTDEIQIVIESDAMGLDLGLPRSIRNLYDKRELKDIQTTLDKLLAAQNNQITGAKDALDRYLDERRAIVAETDDVITILHHSIPAVPCVLKYFHQNNSRMFRWVYSLKYSELKWVHSQIDYLHVK